MSAGKRVYHDRGRALSFGAAADRYDRHRPRYPDELIADLVVQQRLRVLDVGAGTGIATRQLTNAGAEAVALEPDEQMASVAMAKGLAVEVSTFEEWDPRGRTFDLVVFAQSFHWVESLLALRKAAGLLAPGGRIALLWNRIVPIQPDREQLGLAYAGLLDEWQRPSVDVEGDDLDPLLAEAGLAAERWHYAQPRRYSTDDWVDMVTTYSNVLRLTAADQEVLRNRLRKCIGPGGVEAINDALVVLCASV